ncbi:MAG: type II secretion system F family protein [Eubacteriales bacterium]|nr:type II secretion system F family protein [Eubacteriales bacterium]
MAKFAYKVMTPTNETLRGSINAKDRTDALVLLREKGYRPIAVSQKVEAKDIDIMAITNRVKIKDIAVFARQFYTMLNSGISIIQCLDILRQQFDNKHLREIINELYESVQKGSSLSDSMKQYKRVFPELLINMIEAGEASGNLDAVLQRMAEHYEKDTRIRRKIQGAMVYPIVLSVITTLVVVFLLTFVLPTFIEMFTSSGVELPLPTRILLGASEFLTSYWYVVLGVILLSAYLIRRFNKTEQGKHFFDSIKLSLPIVKHVTIRVATARFARTLSTLLASGIPLLNGMEITARVVGNKVVEQTILSIREDVRKGFDLAGPIRRSKLFPPMVDSMIHIGEESGSLDDVLKRTADFYDEEVEMSIQKMTSMLEPLMIVIMALVVGSIVIAIASPMFKMFETIQ